MAEVVITREGGAGRHGRYVARVAGIEAEAELTFTRRGPGMVSADHTGAPETLRGTGAALALVLRMVADAREGGWRIIPLCPYVKAQLARHPEWADAFAAAPEDGPP